MNLDFFAVVVPQKCLVREVHIVMQKGSFLILHANVAKLDTTVKADHENKLARWENTTLKRADPLHLVAEYVKKAFIATNPSVFLQKPVELANNPPLLEQQVIVSNVLKILNDEPLTEKARQLLAILVERLIRKIWTENLDNLRQMVSVFAQVINDYYPARVVVPSTVHPWSQAFVDLANRADAETLCITDGLQVSWQKTEEPLSMDGTRPRVKYTGVNNYLFEWLNCNLLENSDWFRNAGMHLPRVKARPIGGPTDSYYAMVCFPYGVASNLNYRWDLRFEYCFEALSVLLQRQNLKMAVKVKPGGEVPGEEKFLLRELLDLSGYKDVEIWDQDMRLALPRCNLVIGGFSSALLEATFSRTNYFCYEPLYNGVCDKKIESSIVSQNQVARTLEQLSENIMSNRFISLKSPREGSEIALADLFEN